MHIKFVFGFIVFLLMGGETFANNAIKWIVLDHPPAYIVKKKDPKQGFADYVQKKLELYLIDYKHHTLIVNSRRHQELLNKHENICFAYTAYLPDMPVLDKEKEGSYLRSLPWSPHPALELIAKKETIESRFGPVSSIDFEELLKDKSLKLGLPGKRWTDPLKSLILRYEKDGKLNSLWNASSDFGSIFKMLLADRIDYTVAYGLSVKYWQEHYNIPEGRVTTIPISEFKYYYFRVAAACIDNKWGKSVVQKMNDYFRTSVPTREWRSNFEKWLPKSDLPIFRNYYNTMLLESYGFLDGLD